LYQNAATQDFGELAEQVMGNVNDDVDGIS